ncbi:Nn.00g003130.m01.CDS01 [Neocucurbitaria sp. VM-36]
MITVAVAGGTSPGLGRSVVTAIQRYPNQLKVVVLSRQALKAPEWLEEIRVEVRKVDYSSEDSLYDALQDVICVLLAADGTWASTQKNLLKAGLRAGVSRFAPAEFGVGPRAARHVTMFQPSLEVMAACREAKQKYTDFEYAGFHVGLFMNYLGYGAPDEKAATHEMRDTWVFVWDVKNMKADIPLSKEIEVPRMTMTEIGDVGRFVAAACLLPKGSWREDFSMAGDTLKIDEIVKIIEKVRGGLMAVTYRQYEEIDYQRC